MTAYFGFAMQHVYCSAIFEGVLDEGVLEYVARV
jgi:hypothetical protein